jgi:membrane protease YdiL (CAAX protease family)
MIASNYSYRPDVSRHRWVPSLIAATVLVTVVGGTPFVIRDLVRALSLQFASLPNVGATAPFAFLLFILAVSRFATHGPLVLLDDRTLVRRWLTDGALFAFAMAALLLCAVVLNRHDVSSLPDFVSYRMRDVVVPALTEEIAFRGFLTVALTAALRSMAGDDHRSSGLAVVVTSLVFAFAHQPVAVDPRTVFAARFVAGLTFGLLTLHSRSLVPAMFAHAAVNAELLRC